MKTKTKKSAENAQIIKMLESVLNESDRLWNTREESHAYIIGYLTGAIKVTINELK